MARNERFRNRIKAIRDISLSAVVLAVVAGGVLTLSSAAKASGLVVEALTVPPRLVERGMDGKVLAGRLLDRLSAMARRLGPTVKRVYAVDTFVSSDTPLEQPTFALVPDKELFSALAGVYPNAAFKFLVAIGRILVDRLRQSNQRYIDSLLFPIAETIN